MRRLSYANAKRHALAVVALIHVEALLHTRPLERVCARLGISPPGKAGEPRHNAPSTATRPLTDRERQVRVRTTSRAVDRTARCLPLPNTCLRRALALGWLLRDLRPALRIGVNNTAPFRAHAWLDINGEPVGTDGANSSAYQALKLPTVREQ